MVCASTASLSCWQYLNSQLILVSVGAVVVCARVGVAYGCLSVIMCLLPTENVLWLEPVQRT